MTQKQHYKEETGLTPMAVHPKYGLIATNDFVQWLEEKCASYEREDSFSLDEIDKFK